MPTFLNRQAFQKLIDENIEWLLSQEHSLERDHIEAILKIAPELIYEAHPIPYVEKQREKEPSVCMTPTTNPPKKTKRVDFTFDERSYKTTRATICPDASVCRWRQWATPEHLCADCREKERQNDNK